MFTDFAFCFSASKYNDTQPNCDGKQENVKKAMEKVNALAAMSDEQTNKTLNEFNTNPFSMRLLRLVIWCAHALDLASVEAAAQRRMGLLQMSKKSFVGQLEN